MALNLKDALETVKRAGFDPDDRINTGRPERRMVDGEFLPDQDLAEKIRQCIDNRNPENLSLDQLLDIDEL